MGDLVLEVAGERVSGLADLFRRIWRLGAGQLGRAARQRVLDDAEASPVLEQLVAQRLELLVRQAAVVGDDQRLR